MILKNLGFLILGVVFTKFVKKNERHPRNRQL